jgi:hypothetical protein
MTTAAFTQREGTIGVSINDKPVQDRSHPAAEIATTTI